MSSEDHASGESVRAALVGKVSHAQKSWKNAVTQDPI